jgi:hypothetical protein
MAPPAADVDTQPSSPVVTKSPTVTKSPIVPDKQRGLTGLTQSASFPTPLAYSGTLDQYESFDVTSIIGREFPKLQLTDILNDDAKIRDLAILGVYY